MPGVVKIRNNAGGVYESYVKWLPDEVLHMGYNNLMGMLLEMREFAHFCTGNYQVISSCYNRCSMLKEKKDHAQSMLIGFGIATLVLIAWAVGFIALGVYLNRQDVISLCVFPILPLFIIVPFLIFYTVSFIRAYIPYRSDYKRLFNQGKMTETAFHEALCNARFVDYNSGLMVLPAYFTNAMALDFMCDMVRNQRALTLGQAVNLYERYMEEQRRIGMMKAQLAVQQKAASYAQSAAISSAFTAANTFFRW